MSPISRKPIHTLLLTGCMAGMGAILFAVAFPVSEWLGQTFSIGDDWSLLTLPASIIIGLALRVRSGTKLWLKVFSAIMLASYIALMGSLVVHQIAGPKGGLAAASATSSVVGC